MSKQKISLLKRFALWRAHGEKCRYCRQPLSFADLWVEHIIPEELKNKSQKLSKVISDYELDSNFDLNDYENWLTAHHYCNRDKGRRILDKSAALHFIGIAKANAPKAKREEEMLNKTRTKEILFTNLGLGIKGGLITREEVTKFLDTISHSMVQVYQTPPEQIVITFGLSVAEVIESVHVPDGMTHDYAALCDWLENELTEHVASIVSRAFYYPEASARTGETLSVRLAFLELDFDELENFKSDWWKILEISYYSELYDVDDWFEPLNSKQ